MVQIKENMFQRYKNLFSKPAQPQITDKTSQYEVIISVWNMSQRKVTITILKGDKVVWELKSHNLNTLKNDEAKMEHMIKSMNLNLNTIKITKKLNGKVIDELGESVISEGRRIQRVNATVPAKRLGLKVGETNDLGDGTTEIMLPRNDLETRKKLLKPLIDSGYKIVNTVRNMKIDIVTLKNPLNEAVLNELSNKTMKSYIKRSVDSLDDLRDKENHHWDMTKGNKGLYSDKDGHQKEALKTNDKYEKRKQMVGKAVDKLTKEQLEYAIEHFEELDELSKKTLNSYIDKSKKDYETKMNALSKTRSAKKGNELVASARKRANGLNTAISKYIKPNKAFLDAEKKLTKEDVEPIEELSKKTIRSYVKQVEPVLDPYNRGGHSQNSIRKSKVGMALAAKKLANKKKINEDVELTEALHPSIKLVEKPHYNADHKAYDVHHNGEKIGEISSHTTTQSPKKNSIRMSNDGKSKTRWKGQHKDGSAYYHYTTKNNAADSVWGEHKVKNNIKEQVEPIEELSRKTLGSYINKSAKDIDNKAYVAGSRATKHDHEAEAKINVKTEKRKAGIKKAVANLTKESVEQTLAEYVLDFQQRRKRSMNMKKNKNKIKQARARKEKRLATSDQLMVRAKRMAIQLVRRRFAGKMGADYNNLSVGQKIQVDKKIESKKGLVKKIAMRILPKVRQKELARFKNRGKTGADGSTNPTTQPATV